MDKIEYYDLNDTKIEVGSFVAYAASWGRCPVLKYGIVTRLESRKENAWYKESKENPTLRVLTVDRNEKWKDGKKISVEWELQKKGKEVTLSFLDRLLVVTSVPLGAKKVLTEAFAERNK